MESSIRLPTAICQTLYFILVLGYLPTPVYTVSSSMASSTQVAPTVIVVSPNNTAIYVVISVLGSLFLTVVANLLFCFFIRRCRKQGERNAGFEDGTTGNRAVSNGYSPNNSSTQEPRMDPVINGSSLAYESLNVRTPDTTYTQLQGQTRNGQQTGVRDSSASSAHDYVEILP